MEDQKKHSLLIVDDSTANIIALAHMLDQEYDVYVSKDGHDAIEVAKERLPDVILLDIVMPGMDGYQVIDALKNYEKTKDIPIIFITGLGDADDEERGLSLGAADYITKPFGAAIVKLRVRNQIKILEQLRTIEHMSLTDQLTDLPNRRSFDSRLREEWARSERDWQSFSVLEVDVDRFKVYNDTYGHPQGDIALQEVSRAFSALQRPGDFAARWGGEEFYVLLPNTGMEGALEVAERIRKHIEDMEILTEDGAVTKITASIGVNTKEPDMDVSLNEFISEVDGALYCAKETGRNKVVHYAF
ncbi:MAG: diguanylate cyclase [Defluviitaleaceae bacterium]|nr:diguanylate cyclase [Defluviitaleaceae bacterium]